MSTEPIAAEDEFNNFFDNLSSLAAEKKPIPPNFGTSPDVTVPTPAAPVVDAASEPVAASPV